MKKINDFIDESKTSYYLTNFLIQMESVLPTLKELLKLEDGEGLYYGTLLLYSKLYLNSDANLDLNSKDIKNLITMTEDYVKQNNFYNINEIIKEFSRNM